MNQWVMIGIFITGLLIGTTGTGLMFAIEHHYGRDVNELHSRSIH